MQKMVILVIMAAVLLGGCSGMSYTEQRTLSGGVIGAGGGALIGWAGMSRLRRRHRRRGRTAGRLRLRPIREFSGSA